MRLIGGSAGKTGDPVNATITQDEDRYVVRPTGVLDAVTAPALGQQLTDLVGRGSGAVVVDLSNVTFMDSMGLGTLVKASRRLSRQGRSFRLTGETAAVRRIVEVAGLERLFGGR